MRQCGGVLSAAGTADPQRQYSDSVTILFCSCCKSLWVAIGALVGGRVRSPNADVASKWLQLSPLTCPAWANCPCGACLHSLPLRGLQIPFWTPLKSLPYGPCPFGPNTNAPVWPCPCGRALLRPIACVASAFLAFALPGPNANVPLPLWPCLSEAQCLRGYWFALVQ